MTWAGLVLVALGLFLTGQASAAAEKALVTWHPSKPRIGDVAWVEPYPTFEMAWDGAVWALSAAVLLLALAPFAGRRARLGVGGRR